MQGLQDVLVGVSVLLIHLDIHLDQLSRKVVQNIHLSGGSLLGVSRGGPGTTAIVDSMEVLILADT